MKHRGDSQPAISDDNAPVAPAHRPTWWTVRRGRAISRGLLGLALATGLLSVYFTYEAAQDSAEQASAVDDRLTVLERDLAERTEQRDAERDAAAAQAEQDRELFRARFCEVLAELSATFPNLGPVEEALHCAPTPAVTSAPSSPSPGRSPTAGQAPSPARRSSSAPVPSAAPPTPAPAPPSEPPAHPGVVCGLLPLLC